MTPLPADQDNALRAFRLGWAISETRGRLRTGPPAGAAALVRPEHALPLEDERTWAEQTIEVEAIVCALAQKMGVNLTVGELSGQYGNDTCGSHLVTLSKALSAARNANAAAKLKLKWDETCEFFYAWDEKIQDTLAPGSFSVTSAYQLGRGLAEIYWALDATKDEDDPRSWSFLLGESRVSQLKSLLNRLADFFPLATAQSVSDSLSAWAEVAADQAVRNRKETVDALHKQIRSWHDALLLEQALALHVPAQDLLKRARQVVPILRAFVPEVSLGVIGFAAAGVAAALFAAKGVAPELAPVLVILGGFGITGSGALAKAKNEAHSLFAQLQQAMDTDLATQEITLPPARDYLDTGSGPLERRSRERALRKLRNRDA